MPGDEARLEEWIAERLCEWQALASSGPALAAGEFVARATSEESLRAPLLERLRTLRRLEDGFAVLREEAIGPGTELADFEILEPIGAGGMGRVFRARQRSVGRFVAIKVPHRSAALEPAARQRLLREAQAVALLRHPNIVPLLQVGEHEGAPFLVFELSEGKSLGAILADLVHGRVPRAGESLGRPGEPYERAAIQVVLSVLDGLAAAHEAGIVHRDVKPHNVLLEGDGRVRVVDFGLARRIDQDTLTESRELIGTVSYMAPEVARSPHAAGPWSDVWSAGVVLYELLALRRPFEGESALQILRRIETSESVPLHVSQALPKPLSAIVEKALSREIGARYASTTELARDLRAWLDGREVGARPSTGLSRLGRRLNRRPALTAVSVALALVLALLAGVWRSSREVRAQVRLSRAETITRDALLWWNADAGPSGRATASTAGRLFTIEELERALREAPHLVEARVELAQCAALASQDERALELIDGLEAEGLRLRCLEWARALVRDPDRRSVRPDPEETLDLASVAELDRLAWARHLLQSYQSELAMEILRPIEAHRILAAAARYGQFEACHTRGRRDPLYAIACLEAVLMLSPEHPLVLTNLASVLYERWTVMEASSVLSQHERQARDNLAAELQEVLPKLARAEPRTPWLSTLWINHAALLGGLGRIDEAASIARAGLEHHPGDGTLTNMLAQTYFSRWRPLREHGEPVPERELEELRRILETSLGSPPILSQNLYNLTRVHFLRGDRQATLDSAERTLTEYLDHAPAGELTDQHQKDFDTMMEWALQASEQPEAR